MADSDDPLISQPPGELHVPPGLSDDEKFHWLLESAMDHVNLHQMAWPARNGDGALVPPTDDHVLDYLARAYELVDEERQLSTLAAGTVAVVQPLPDCDFCEGDARYDASLEAGGQSAGAFLCPDCYTQRGSGSLGASGDVYLMTPDEVSDVVRQRYDAAAAIVGKPPLR